MTDAAAQSSMLVTVLAASPVKLTGKAVSSMLQLSNVLQSLHRSLDRMKRGLNGYVFDAANAVAVYLSQLHDLSTEFAKIDQMLQVHLATGGSAGTDSSRLYTNRSGIRKKMDRCVSLLRQLAKLSSDTVIQNTVAAIPDVVNINGPKCLPTCVGSINIVPGDLDGALLLEAYNARRAARDELSHASTSISKAIQNVQANISQLREMLRSLTRAPHCGEDSVALLACLQRGAGASGLWGGMHNAMFDLLRSSESSARCVKLELAAGMASYVAEGLMIWQEQLRQLVRLNEALRQLRASSDHLSIDKKKRADAFRYGRQMLKGTLSPADWVRLATGVSLPAKSTRILARNIARNSAMTIDKPTVPVTDTSSSTKVADGSSDEPDSSDSDDSSVEWCDDHNESDSESVTFSIRVDAVDEDEVTEAGP